MTTIEIAAYLSDKLGSVLTAVVPEDRHPRVHLDVADWRPVAEMMRRDPRLSFDWLANLTGLDYPTEDRMAVAYDLQSVTHRHSFAVKVYVPRATPKLPTVIDLWPSADWHEREAFDLLGIDFEGHPDLRRILLAEDWEGYPLRKDYLFPREYHGIPASVELDWGQNRDELPAAKH